MKKNWWVKLYTIPALKSYAQIFVAPLLLSAFTDWDLVAAILTVALCFLFKGADLRKQTTFYKNIKFHQNHVPLKELKANLFLHRLIVCSVSLLCFVAMAIFTESGFQSTSLFSHFYSYLTFWIYAWMIFNSPEFLTKEKDNKQRIGFLKSQGLLYLLIFFVLVFYLCVSEYIGLEVILASVVLAVVASYLSYKTKLIFHEITEITFFKSVKLFSSRMLVFFSLLVCVGFGVTRNFNHSNYLAENKFFILQAWPVFVENISFDNFMQLEKMALQGSEYELLYSRLDKNELNEVSPESFIVPGRVNLLYGYLKHATLTPEKLSYINDTLERDSKAWLNQISQSRFGKLTSNVKLKLAEVSPKNFEGKKTIGTVEGVEREIAYIQEIPEETHE